MYLPNNPVERLTPEIDYLGLIPKADSIKLFFEQKHDFKITALYGEWGSGKSTLINYLKSELHDKYNVFVFEAWKFEKDNNLAYSLIDFLAEESTSITGKVIDELIKDAYLALSGFTKSISFNFPGISFSPGELINAVEERTAVDLKDSSYYKKQKSFIKSYKGFENKSKNPLLIIVDDLDRCEPENVLNLLSALKLFFTYSSKTKFICALDKLAVEKAIKIKYGDVIKSEEYLEKVFDYSFAMPKYYEITKLVNQYFTKGSGNKSISTKDFPKIITDFFTQIDFTNPRHLKKVLNKYNVILNSIEWIRHQNNHAILPNLIVKDEGSIFETIITLFYIILHDHYY